MKTEHQLITPKMAEFYLKTNDSNRPIRQKSVNEYADLMLNGEWDEAVHQGIAFDVNGKLVDGQHRLLACIKANLSIKFNVTTGVSEKSFMNMDRGYFRTNGNLLAISGIPNYNNHAAGIGGYLVAMKNLTYETSKKEAKVTAQNILDFYKENEILCNHLLTTATNCLTKFRLLTKSNIYSMYLQMINAGHTANEIDKFFFELFSISEETNSVTTILRERLFKNAISKTKLPIMEINALIIKSFNFFILNQEVKSLRWNSITETYPKIKSK